MQVTPQRRERVSGRVRHAAGQALVEEAAEGVDIRVVVDRLAADLFGRRIADRPDELSRTEVPIGKRRPGHAEVGKERPLFVLVLVQQDIGRLDVTVDEPVCVGSIERGRELRDERDGSRRFEAALFAQQACQVTEGPPLVFTYLVDGKDASVNHRRRQPRLAFVALLPAVSLVRVGRDQLEGDRLVAAGAGGAVDHGRGAPAEHLPDRVARNRPLLREQAERAHRAAAVIDQR